MKKILPLFKNLYRFYADGFNSLSGWGKNVWIIIIIKLFIMFAILRIFFFPDFLKSKFNDDKQRGEYVLDQLINSSDNHD